MPESPSPSADSYESSGYMPSYAQGYSNLANPYALQTSMGGDPFFYPEPYGAFYPQGYMAQGPYGVPFAIQNPLLGQAVDVRSLYGPFTQYPYGPYLPEAPFAISAPQDIAASQGSNGAGAISPSIAPSAQYGQNAMPEHSGQTSRPIQASQQMQPSQQLQQFDAAPSEQASVQTSTQSSQSSQTHPSVQVVVQPSQPFAPVQSQKAASAQTPAPSMQSQMPTGVLQPVPQMGQQYGSGMLYPPQSSPFFDDYIAGFDPDMATGGRVAGATFLGILSIPFSVFAPLGLLFSLVGLHLANTYLNNGGGRGVGNFARFFNVVGLILTIVITAAVALYIGYSAGQDGFLLFGEDPIAFINNSDPMQFLYDQWNKLQELWPW